MKGAECDDNITGNKNNYTGAHYSVCNPCRVRSCKTKRYCSYNRVVHALDHMRNRVEVKRMYKDMITKEIMQKCIDQGMTQTEMAVSLDASFEIIHRLLKQYDLKPAYNHDTGKYDEEKMKRCLQQGMTAKEIAQAFGVISTTVSRWKKKYDLDIPPTPRTPRRKKVTDCKTCNYRARNKDLLYECDYYSKTGHTRNMGQPEEICSKYEKGKRGRRSGKRKV